jgi:nicotinamidase-related amidase
MQESRPIRREDTMKAAVLVIDMLNDFVTGKLGNERVRSVIEPIRH